MSTRTDGRLIAFSRRSSAPRSGSRASSPSRASRSIGSTRPPTWMTRRTIRIASGRAIGPGRTARRRKLAGTRSTTWDCRANHRSPVASTRPGTAGGSGLSIAYDMPTLYGYDHDEPQAEGEFGTCGVAVSSLADMELLLADLPVGEISTSMTINSPAPMIWAMYISAAEKMGAPRADLSGTLQNDILKEFIAQKEYIFPPAPSLKLVTDTVEWGTRELPRWNTISISGYHIREAGSTAVQELAFTIADGIAYVED